MKLSRLAYEVVKSSLKLGNQDFVYEAFRQKDFDSDVDYSADIDNCFTEINQAIHRLSDLNKIPFKVESFETNEGSSIFDFSTTELNIKHIIAIVKLDESNGDYENIPFRTMGANKVNLMGIGKASQTLYVEYVEDIPNFTSEDFDYSNYEDVGDEYTDVDLKDYGINETMCSKIILYASARLFAKVDPQIAAKEESVAEQYFDALPVHGTSFRQKVIRAAYRIGD